MPWTNYIYKKEKQCLRRKALEPIRPFIMPLYKCKKCGKIICEPQLKSFCFTYGDYKCCGRWCLCEDCILQGATKPKSAYFTKTVLSKNFAVFLKELAEIISQFKVNVEDVFYEEEK